MSITAIRRNEQRKLSATWCNTVATGLLTIGVFAPSVAIILGVEETQGNINALGWTIIGASAAAVFLHLGGRRILGRLEE
ncbi:hypothetical protein [Tardiphaga robiniae]|uniref:Amino acid transporter n=1 Tax=Tardiphaga robiniae TaxID=943830 RepID=A0A7G6TZD5_9BRAD|nr:hypothetical protein [Tardiphaga robiniae]QND72117.1 hypothetical protein HB776_13475 [Tardiphaga robiniae]